MTAPKIDDYLEKFEKIKIYEDRERKIELKSDYSEKGRYYYYNLQTLKSIILRMEKEGANELWLSDGDEGTKNITNLKIFYYGPITKEEWAREEFERDLRKYKYDQLKLIN